MPRTACRLSIALALALIAALPVASASARELYSGTVASATKSPRICHDRLATGKRGVVTRRVRIDRASAITARLTAGRRDWDVAVFRAGQRRAVAASAGLRSIEVAQGMATPGVLTVQACRRSGPRRAKLAVSALALRGGKTSDRIQLLEVATPTHFYKSRLVELGLDVTEHAGRDYVEVVTYNEKERDLLRAAGFTWTVSVGDMVAQSRAVNAVNRRYAARTAVSPLPSGRDTYRRLADYEAEMKLLAEQNPGLVRSFVLPYRTVEGREVFGIEIARNVNASDGRPTFALMGVHHAREWPSGEHTIEFAHDLVKGFGTDARMTDVLTRVRAMFVPVVNVDGFNVSREHLGLAEVSGTTANALADPGSEYRRRNCRLVGGPPSEPGEQAAFAPSPPGACMLPAFRTAGTDPNRNYGALWGGPGASALPAYDTYRGSGPFSEPETQNIRWLVSHRQITTLITNHTYSNLILRAPGVRAQGVPVDEELMADLGSRMAAQNGYTSQPGWALYDTTGTTEDWSYNATGGFGYTFEIGPSAFHPAYPQMIDEYVGHAAYAGKGNRAAYLIALENAGDATKHSVLTGKAPANTVLRLTKSFETTTSPVRPAETDVLSCGPTTAVTEQETAAQRFTDTLDTTMTANGKSFAWHVNPSTRPSVQEHREILTEDVRSQTWTHAPDPADPSIPAADHRDYEFVIDPADSFEYLAVALDWDPGTGTTPEDYDLEVYRKEGETLTRVGGAGEVPGCAEYTEIPNPGPGTYVLRVVNFAAATQQWQLTATLKRFAGYRTIPASGGPESWTFRCETPDGAVIAERQVVIGRGQQVDLGGNACGSKKKR